jgi:hypothetical protein
LVGGINPYTYAYNDPINFIDPYGLLSDILIQFANPGIVDPQLRTYSDEDLRRAGNDLSDFVDQAIKDIKPEYLNPKIGPFFAIADKINDLIFSDSNSGGSCPNGDDDERDPAQDKRLNKGEIKKLKKAGHDPHDLKPEYQGSRYDLFKDRQGNIYVKPRNGAGPGDPTGLNINNL